MNLSSDPQPGTGLQSYPTASLNPQPREEVILCPLSDNETEGQSGHLHTVVETAKNVDGLIRTSASGLSLTQESPLPPRPPTPAFLAHWLPGPSPSVKLPACQWGRGDSSHYLARADEFQSCFTALPDEWPF